MCQAGKVTLKCVGSGSDLHITEHKVTYIAGRMNVYKVINLIKKLNINYTKYCYVLSTTVLKCVSGGH